MTTYETQEIIEILSTNPHFVIQPKTFEVWYATIGHLDIHIVKMAVFRLLQTSPYPPTPSDIITQATKLMQPDHYINATDAWGTIIKAVHEYGFYRAKDGIASLPPYLQKIVQSIGWREICSSPNPDVLRGEFLKMYSAHQVRAQEQAMLAPSQRLLELTQATFSQN